MNPLITPGLPDGYDPPSASLDPPAPKSTGAATTDGFHDMLCPLHSSLLDQRGTEHCVCSVIAEARADEREKTVEALFGSSYDLGWLTAADKTTAVIDAARAWVGKIVDPPSWWADEQDFALIEAVKALETASKK